MLRYCSALSLLLALGGCSYRAQVLDLDLGTASSLAVDKNFANADGVERVTVTLSLKHQDGTAAPGLSVQLRVSDPNDALISGGAVIDPNTPLTTDASGRITASFTSKDAGVKVLTGSVLYGNQALALRNASVTFTVPSSYPRLYMDTSNPNPTAGDSVSVTFTVVDAQGAVQAGYLGTLLLSTSDANATLPEQVTLTPSDAGVKVVPGVVFKGAGIRYLTGTDAALPALTGQTRLVVQPAAAAGFQVSVSGSSTAGQAAGIIVTAVDAYNNVVPSYTGQVTITANDPNNTNGVPAMAGPLTANFTTIDQGQVILPGALTLQHTDNQVTLTVTGPNPNGAGAPLSSTRGPFAVMPAAADHLQLALDANQVNAGGKLVAQVQAHDVFDNLVTTYAGTVRLASSDARAVLPPPYTFNPVIDAGQHSLTLTLNTANPNALVTAQDANGAPPAAASAAVTVLPVGPYLSGAWTSTSNNTATAGSAQTLTVRAYNLDGSAMTSYSGKVALSSTDPNASLGGPITVTAGVGIANNVALTTAGAQYVTLADTQDPNMAGSSHVLTVTPGPAAHYVLAGGNAVAGTPYAFSITAKDAYGNTATGYTGRANVTTTDSRAVVTNRPFNASDAGVVQTTMLFKTAGMQTVNANDSVAGNSISGSLAVNVDPGAPGNFALRLNPNQLVAGHATSATVDVRDSYGNATPNYTGTLAWRTGNANAVLPPNYTFTAADAGSHTFANALVFYASGTSAVYVSDTSQSTINGAASVTVSPDAPSRLTLVGPANRAVAGVAFQVTLTATDQYGNTTPNTGVTLHYSSDDPNSAGLPTDAPLSTTGQQTNSVKLFTAGARTLNANAVGSPSIAAASITFAVNPGDANTFTFTNVSASYVAGQPLGFTVNAKDLYGNTATGYAGTVLLSSTDQAFTSGQYTFTTTDVGSHAFTNSLHTAGNQNVLVQDSTTPGLKGLLIIPVSPAAATSLTLRGLADAAAGSAQNCNVIAVDVYGNRATGYTGTVSLASTDANAALPAAYAYQTSDAGRHLFSGITFKTASAQTLTASDGTLNGNITVNIKNAPAAVLRFSGNPNKVIAGALFSARVTAYDAYNNLATDFASSVSFSVSPSGSNAATLPAAYTYQTSDAGAHNNPNAFALNRSPQMTLTATSASPNSITGSVTLTVQAGNANGFFVSGLSQNANAGTPMSVTVQAVDNFNNTATGYTGTVAFSSNDNYPLTVLPSSRTFLVSDNGSFTITNGVKLTKAQSAAYVRVTDINAAGLTGAQTGITVKGLPATQLLVSGIGDPATAGVPQQFNLSATDGYTNVDTTKNGPIAGTAYSTDPNAVLPIGPFSLSNGTTTVSGLQLRTGGQQSVYIKDPNYSWTPQNVTVVANPNANRIAFDPNSVPTTQTTCAVISPAVRVRVFDRYNNVITSNANNIQMNAQNGNLFGTNKQPVQSGVASFGDLSLDANGTTRLHATLVGSALSADSNVIAVSGSSAGPAVVLNGVSSTASCIDLSFTVSACGAPVLLQPRYANPASPTNPNFIAATVASSSAAGLYGVPSSRAISLRWDSVRDVGHRNGNYNFDIGAQVGGGILGHGSTVLAVNNAPIWAVKSSTSPGASIQSLAVADFDRDGAPDTVAVDGNVVMVWLANGSVTQQSFSGGMAPTRVATGDINRDGIPDAVVCASSSSSNTGLYTLLGKADGSLSAPASNPLLTACSDLALADVDHDGSLDAITFDTSTNEVLWTRAYAPTAQSVNITALGFTPQGRPVPADVTGDGNIDLVLLTDASNNSDTVALLVGTGAGFGSLITTKPPGNALPLSSIATGDLDNNGTVDLVLGNSTGYWVYDAMSTSGFGRSANAPITGRAADSTLLADADGDGYLDLFARSSNGLTVYAGAPIAQDFNTVLFAASLSSPAAFAVADLNHDALVDVLINEGKSLERWVNQMPRSCDGIRFGATLATATAAMPSGLASADFDRDGKFDVAIAHAANGNNALEVFRGDGAGGLVLKTNNLGSSAGIVYGLPAAGDLNGDGLVDLAVPGITSGGSANVWVFAGDGNGNFGAGTAYGVDPNAGQVAIADFNGDGRSDLLVTTSNPNTLDLLLAPNFNKQTVSNISFTPTRVFIGSVTANKRADVLAYNATNFVVLVNDGVGNLAAVSAPCPVPSIRGAVIADITQDGNAEIIVANDAQSELGIYPGDGTGAYTASVQSFPVHACIPAGLATADLDRALGPDLVILCTAPTGLELVYNDGTGGSSLQLFIPTAGGLSDVTIRDMSSDRYPDILTLSQNANTVSLALNAGLARNGNDFYTSNFSDEVTLDPNAVGAALADINGDGVLDAVVGNANNAAVHVRLGQLSGALGLSQPVDSSRRLQSVCTADIDNDGDQDILAGDFGTSSLAIERNTTPRGNATVSFSSSSIGSLSSNANVTALAVGDIDNDGKVDVVAGMLSGFAVYLDIGTGNATATQAPTSGVAVGDIDSDGWQDVVVTSASANTVTIWYNDRTGNLGNSGNSGNSGNNYILSMNNAPTGVAVGDIDNDGKPDIVVALAGGPRTQLGVISNQGNNNFSIATVDSGITPSGGVMAADVVLADLNRDGKLDALVPSLRDYGLVAFTGQGIIGTQAFLASTSFVSLGSALRSVAVGDMNHDGRPDLLLVDDLDAEMSMALGR